MGRLRHEFHELTRITKCAFLYSCKFVKFVSVFFLLFAAACSEQKKPEPVENKTNVVAAAPTKNPPLQFPKDEGVHPESPFEWWYLNSQFSDAAGKKYAFFFCTFSTGRHLVSFFDKSADTCGTKDYYESVDASTEKLDFKSITSKWKQTAEPFTYNFHYDFQALTLDLILKSNKKPFQPGGDGFVAMGEKGTSRYYALTDLTLAGTVTMGTNKIEVSGHAWMDHQWGKWDWANDFSQWKWFSVQLDNGTDLMLFNLYKNKKLLNSHCGYIDAKSQQFHNLPCELVTQKYYTDETGGKWQKEIVLNFPSLPNTKLTLISEKDLQFAEQKVLWEGSMKVDGVFKGTAVKGSAFGELNRPD